MKECPKIKRLLSRYIDKEISKGDNLFVETHLGKCFFCKKELEELNRVRSTISIRKRKELDLDRFITGLLWEIDEEESINAQPLSRLAGMGELSRKFIPVPTILIILLFTLLILNSRDRMNMSSLEDNMLKGAPMTKEAALELVLGEQD